MNYRASAANEKGGRVVKGVNYFQVGGRRIYLPVVRAARILFNKLASPTRVPPTKKAFTCMEREGRVLLSGSHFEGERGMPAEKEM